MAVVASTTSDVRIITLYPTLNWPQIWRNLQTARVPDEVKSAWFLTIHDVIPTNEHLFKIHLVDTNRCNHSDQIDTLSHRMTECNVGKGIWDWTRERIAIILRTNKLQVPAAWPFWPHFHTWSPQWHFAILWILAYWCTITLNTATSQHIRIMPTSCVVHAGKGATSHTDYNAWRTA